MGLSAGVLAFFGVLGVIQIALLVIALVVLLRTPNERLVFGIKWPWVLIVVLISMIGPIVFLAVGRRPAPVVDPSAGASAPYGDVSYRTIQNLYGTPPQDGPSEPPAQEESQP
jgi:hypothetical protein